MLTGKVADHPAQFSPEVLDAIAPLIASTLLSPGAAHVHDPFAGLGLRLGALCDRLGITYSGADIEAWPSRDPRVMVSDSTIGVSYPPAPFVIVTSPVYFGNRISSDYVNGATPATKLAGRRAYGISLGRALDRANLARVCRPAHEAAYYARHGAAVRHWGARAVVNVDAPMAERWADLLAAHGYAVAEPIEVRTRRLGGVANADKRASHEVVLVAERAQR